MKKLIWTLGILLSIGVTSCSEDAKKEDAKQEKEVYAASTSINIRYVDQDSILANYNLAKDYESFIVRTSSNYERQIQTKQTELQQFATQIDQKVKSNGYLSEASYNADLERLGQMQKDAETYIARLERQAQEENLRLRAEILDSINSVLIDYNNLHHFDAILWKSAGATWNDSLDVTGDIIKELNARYTPKK